MSNRRSGLACRTVVTVVTELVEVSAALSAMVSLPNHLSKCEVEVPTSKIPIRYFDGSTLLGSTALTDRTASSVQVIGVRYSQDLSLICS